MPHLIILDRNKQMLKNGADASVDWGEIHEAHEALAAGALKTSVGEMIDAASDALNDFNSDYAGRIAAIKDALGI